MKEAEEKYGMTNEKYAKIMEEAQGQATRDWDAQHKRQKAKREADAAEEETQRKPSNASLTAKSKSGSSKAAAAPTKRDRGEGSDKMQVEETEKEHRVPEWYSKVDTKGRKMKMTLKDNAKRQVIQNLEALKDTVRRCEVERNSSVLAKLFNDLRNNVHNAEFLEVDEYILVRTHMLDDWLPRIFNAQGTVQFPWDLKADTLQLYQRWAVKNFKVELLRGIITSKVKDNNRSADKIDPVYRRAYCPLPNHYGQGDLVLGQWWPTQLCTVRDGAHGSAQGGIYGEKEKGAYSIVVAGGGGYDDKDQGDELFYCGTDSKDSTPTEHTMRMIESCDVVKQPIRVIRSANLPLSNPYRPERGYRYDGLYEVVSYTILKKENAVHRFRLVRCAGQFPIRSEKGKPSTRPTKQEIEAYDKEVVERGFNLRAG
jgi:hypothetical protein